jgi:ABC-type nitrate/sulfonate/bicarbonate transport system substrate-binding protein
LANRFHVKRVIITGGTMLKDRRIGLAITALLIVALLAPALAGCAPKEKERLSVKIGITSGSQTIYRYVCAKSGELFPPLGYEVECKVFPDEGGMRAAFVTDEIQITTTLPPLVPSLTEAGQDVQFLMPIAWITQGYVMTVAADSPYQSMDDLKGKKVATWRREDPGWAYYQATIRKVYGQNYDEFFDPLEVAIRPGQALELGQVEAAVVASISWVDMQDTGKWRGVTDLATELKKALNIDHLVMYGGYIAKRSFIEKHNQFTEDFLRVSYEAMKEYKANREAFLKVVADYEGGGASKMEMGKTEFIAWYLGMDDAPAERMYITEADVKDYEQIYSLLYECGWLESPVEDIAKMFYVSPNAPK